MTHPGAIQVKLLRTGTASRPTIHTQHTTHTGLAWTFSAETIAILFVQVLVGLMALTRTQSVLTASCILSLYPLSLVLVWILENVLGFD